MFRKIYRSQLWMRNWKPKCSFDNAMDKYAVWVKKNTSIVGHFPLGKNRTFAKMMFYFLRADQDVEWKVVIIGKEVNLGDGDGSWRFQAQEKWWKFIVKIFSAVQKRANKKLLLFVYFFFHLLSLKSDALNSLILNVFANSKAFSLSMIPSTGTFWLLFPTNQWKTALSIWA